MIPWRWVSESILNLIPEFFLPGSMKDYDPDYIFECLKDPLKQFGNIVGGNIFVDASHAYDKLHRKAVTVILFR